MTRGTLAIVTGPMFAEKSTELIRRLRRARVAGLGVQAFVPARDDRYGVGKIVTHAGQDLESSGIQPTALTSFADLAARVRPHVTVVGIDEANLVPAEETSTVLREVTILLERGVSVTLAGLARDSANRPFGVLPGLLFFADDIAVLRAVCVWCFGDATCSYRVSADEAQVVVGGAEAYEARCRTCHAHGTRAKKVYAEAR